MGSEEKHFGNLAFIRGVVYYRLSPHEQKTIGSAAAEGIAKILPRTMATIFTWLPPFVIGAFTYFYIEDAYKKSKRKNPLDYQYETDPNVPVVCRRAVDIVPGGKKTSPDIPMDPKTVCDPDSDQKGSKSKTKK